MSTQSAPENDANVQSPRIYRESSRSLNLFTELIVVAILISSIWLVHFPALGHSIRSDMWYYQLDTFKHTDFLDILQNSYSYDRIRKIIPSDVQLFRPVLFTLLAAEKGFFANNLTLWEAFGILLHCAVMYLFYRLLLYIYRRASFWKSTSASTVLDSFKVKIVPLALALFVAINLKVQEMVIFPNIHGYMLFIGLFLASILASCQFAYEAPAAVRQRRWAWLVAAWLLAAIAVFTYELGQFFVVALALCLAITATRISRRTRLIVLVAFIAIAPIYQLIDSADYRWHLEQGQFIPNYRWTFLDGDAREELPLSVLLKSVPSINTVSNTVRFLRYNMLQPFFPSLLSVWFDTARFSIHEDMSIQESSAPSPATFLISVLVIVIWIVLTVLGLRGLFSSRHRHLGLIALMSTMLVCYTGINVVGRMNLHENQWWILEINSYYSYFVLIFVITICLCIWSNLPPNYFLPRYKTRNRLVIGTFVLGLLFVSVYNGAMAHGLEASLAVYEQPSRQTIADIQAFIDAHQQEVDFSIAFDLNRSRFPEIHGIPYPDILFGKYLNEASPKYVLWQEDGKILSQNAGQYATGRDSSQGDLFPQLVAVDTLYNIYHYDDSYFAVFYDDGYYDPKRTNYHYLVSAPTLPELRPKMQVLMDGVQSLKVWLPWDSFDVNAQPPSR